MYDRDIRPPAIFIRVDFPAPLPPTIGAPRLPNSSGQLRYCFHTGNSFVGLCILSIGSRFSISLHLFCGSRSAEWTSTWKPIHLLNRVFTPAVVFVKLHFNACCYYSCCVFTPLLLPDKPSQRLPLLSALNLSIVSNPPGAICVVIPQFLSQMERIFRDLVIPIINHLIVIHFFTLAITLWLLCDLGCTYIDLGQISTPM